MFFPFGRRKWAERIASHLIRHFGRAGVAGLSISDRKFPFRVRADLQRAVEQVFGEIRSGSANAGGCRFFGVRAETDYRGVDFSDLLSEESYRPPTVSPPEYEEVDIGEERPVRCLKMGLWLVEQAGTKYAVLLSTAIECGSPSGMRFHVAAPNDDSGARVIEAFFRKIELAVKEARCYRGKILSLERGHSYTGQATGIRVHKLPKVNRDDVILPNKTVDLLERNIVQFVRRRGKLSAAGQGVKKGLLFYGRPGTGKSHTIRYLAGILEGHTTLLVTAEQVAYLDEYMALARLLQPSVLVIEDADLIARDREQMQSAGEEALLNKLLNEMDGLREDAEILFILTTNRPEALEAALASRPGRIDQAIEFPPPDEACREKLVRLYAKGIMLTPEVVQTIVRRTDQVSAAFIKELMRRSAQFHFERAEGTEIDLADVEGALDEMLFSGGSLNVKLLGGDVDASRGPSAERS